MISCIEIIFAISFPAGKLFVYACLFIKVTCWLLFLKLPKASMVIGTINNSQFTDVSCLSFHVQAFLSFFLLFSSDHEYLYCRMKTRRLYSFFISCLQFRCLISYALNFNTFLHIGTFKTSTFEPSSFSLTRSPVILFNLFPDGWSIQSINY